MPAAKKICRVCGKQYEACHTPNTTGVFRWRDVACSIECGAEYLRRVNESRGIVEEKPISNHEDFSPIETVTLEVEIPEGHVEVDGNSYSFFVEPA